MELSGEDAVDSVSDSLCISGAASMAAGVFLVTLCDAIFFKKAGIIRLYLLLGVEHEDLTSIGIGLGIV
ncbi:hypothetical protein OUZ56_017063 [Daphnia magna]|uniref:Uncharacterized protein n=1 Tax=Daphnia magna TaxID=35525 RepID=A0ABR0AS22_9CRUS|nr:hypothetical protein OUZ56_017063 [Daphnia magna]